MPRKTITRLRKLCGRLAGHSRQQAELVTQAALGLIRDQLPEGQETVDLLQFQVWLSEKLAATRDQLTALDNEHAHELQVDRNVREDRDAATKELRERLFQLRDGLDGIYGTGGSAKVFEDAPRIPDDPMEVHQLGGHVRANLRNPAFEMPTVLHQGLTLDREAAASELDEPFLKLDDALRRLENTESESKRSQSKKDSSVVGSRRFADRVARFLESFYDLVGQDRLAQRVRRSSRSRSAGEPEDEGATSAPEEAEEAAEEPAAPASTPESVDAGSPAPA